MLESVMEGEDDPGLWCGLCAWGGAGGRFSNGLPIGVQNVSKTVRSTLSSQQINMSFAVCAIPVTNLVCQLYQTSGNTWTLIDSMA
jgi:hypothetical protein